MQRFLSFWASYSITWPRCKRSFVSNNWCLVWTRSAFPQSFLSCKQSDAERALCDSSVARDKLVFLRHLKRAEPYSGEKLASHIKDYYNNNKRMYEGCRFTLSHNGRRATQLGRFTLWQNGRRNLFKDERFERFSKYRSIVDLQQTLEICTLYEDSENF